MSGVVLLLLGVVVVGAVVGNASNTMILNRSDCGSLGNFNFRI